MIRSLLDPRSIPGAEPIKLAKRLDTIKDKVIGLFDDGKQNANVVLETFKRHLIKCHARDFVYRKKEIGSPWGSGKIIPEMIECDAVVLAVGDCGNCTTWLVTDAVQIEKEGVATAAWCTDAFAPLGATVARSLGCANLPLGVLKHPIGQLRSEEVRKKVEPHLKECIELLTLPMERVIEKYGAIRWIPKEFTVRDILLQLKAEETLEH